MYYLHLVNISNHEQFLSHYTPDVWPEKKEKLL